MSFKLRLAFAPMSTCWTAHSCRAFGLPATSGAANAVELEIIGGMDRDQLALQVSRELGQLQAVTLQHAEDLIAIVLALGGSA